MRSRDFDEHRARRRGFLGALRDDVRKVADLVSIPQDTAEMIKAGVKTGVKVFACLIAANELRTHAGRLIGEASGEVHVFEGDELDEATAHIRETAYNVGTQNGACAAWLHASEHWKQPVPPWVLGEIQRLGEAGQWHQPAVFVQTPSVFVPAQGRENHDEDQAVTEAELIDDEDQADELPPHSAERAAGDAG